MFRTGSNAVATERPQKRASNCFLSRTLVAYWNSRLREPRGDDRYDLAGNIVLRAITIYADPVGTLGLVEIAGAYPLEQVEVPFVAVPTGRLALRR